MKLSTSFVTIVAVAMTASVTSAFSLDCLNWNIGNLPFKAVSVDINAAMKQWEKPQVVQKGATIWYNGKTVQVSCNVITSTQTSLDCRNALSYLWNTVNSNTRGDPPTRIGDNLPVACGVNTDDKDVYFAKYGLDRP
ncbi:hypothetical protein BGX26_007385 [Mortierella sp. AD094]|nr:hypothetical protein BGX26_007385 [Mortierella sp. AD094]